MKNLFSMDNPLMQTLDVAADLITLNLLTLLCSLPIVTAGAAVTAMNDICIHLVRKEEGSIVRGYFRSFRSNFKKGTCLGLLMMAAAGILYFDYLAALTYVPALRIGIVAIALIVLAIGFYAFGLLSRYENTLWVTLKNAASLAIGFFPRTLLMLVFAVCVWLLCLRFFNFGSLILLLLGLSLPCYVCSLLLKDVFQQIEKK